MFLRITVHGCRREMGLGSVSEVSLKEARQQADHWRAFARQGKDPIKERERQRREAERNLHCLPMSRLTRSKVARLNSRATARPDGGFRRSNSMSYRSWARFPSQILIRSTYGTLLKPIWHSKGETARKALNRLSIVLQHAAALGLEVDLQATKKAKLLLGTSRHTPQHIPAMPWIDVPEFYRTLEVPTTTNLALRMLIV